MTGNVRLQLREVPSVRSSGPGPGGKGRGDFILKSREDFTAPDEIASVGAAVSTVAASIMILIGRESEAEKLSVSLVAERYPGFF